MQDDFSKVSPPLSEAEKALQAWGIAYETHPDGTLFVPGHLVITDKKLNALPDLTNVRVGGNFDCSNNWLTSLKGAPQQVGGSFWCTENHLESLEGAPLHVPGSFRCEGNRLTTLNGGPQSTGDSYWCHLNRLTTLKGGPDTVGGSFWCDHNRLQTLEGGPRAIGGDLRCDNNPLTSLKGAPEEFGNHHVICDENTLLASIEDLPLRFKAVRTDQGDFFSWREIPDSLCPPETKRHRENQLLDILAQESIVTTAAVKVGRALSFRRP